MTAPVSVTQRQLDLLEAMDFAAVLSFTPFRAFNEEGRAVWAWAFMRPLQPVERLAARIQDTDTLGVSVLAELVDGEAITFDRVVVARLHGRPWPTCTREVLDELALAGPGAAWALGPTRWGLSFEPLGDAA